MSAEPLRAAASVRARLEQVARSAATAEPGVFVVSSGSDGVFAVAEPGGRYDVTVAIVADIVPLLPLADRLRAQILRAAEAAGLGDELGRVEVRVDDVELHAPGQGSRR